MLGSAFCFSSSLRILPRPLRGCAAEFGIYYHWEGPPRDPPHRPHVHTQCTTSTTTPTSRWAPLAAPRFDDRQQRSLQTKNQALCWRKDASGFDLDPPPSPRRLLLAMTIHRSSVLPTPSSLLRTRRPPLRSARASESRPGSRRPTKSTLVGKIVRIWYVQTTRDAVVPVGYHTRARTSCFFHCSLLLSRCE